MEDVWEMSFFHTIKQAILNTGCVKIEKKIIIVVSKILLSLQI
jgi:hypothetical protein